MGDAYPDLRKLALGMTREQLHLENVPPDEAYGVVMETAHPRAIATLVSFVTGDTSLYFSNGGGMIGEGSHASVAAASKQFVKTANGFIAQMRKTDATPGPDAGGTVFYVLTGNGRRTFAAPEEDLGRRRSAFFPLFYAGQDVITAIRLEEEKRPRE